jgi:hypothetical protein
MTRPPSPTLALRPRIRVGVSGHRVSPKLPPGAEGPVRASVDRVLAAIVEATVAIVRSPLWPRETDAQAAKSGDLENAASFAVVSSLAEGSDRIVAEAGRAAGFELEAVLPFTRSEYAHDFATPESRAAFDRLLGQARTVFELGGPAEARPRAYEAAGYVMLANSDLLIAVWDGREAEGIGGTAQIVNRAVANGIPVVWIDPAKPTAWQLSRRRPGETPPAHARARHADSFHAADAAAVGRAIGDILAPPPQAQAQSALQQYLSERERRWNLCPWFPLLLWIFAGRRPRWDEFRLPDVLAETEPRWRDYFDAMPDDRAQRPTIRDVLLPAFGMADRLAVYYSLVYRGAYVFSFLFAAVAVAFALCGIFTHDLITKSVLVAAELAVIAAILVTWLYGYRRQWHRRWLDYRRLAECLRHIRILAPVGADGPIDPPGRYLNADDQDWVDWYTRSLRRHIPLPSCTVDADYVRAVRDAVCSTEISGQLRYHAGNAGRIEKLDRRMHHSGQWLFGATGILCLLFLIFAAVATRMDSAHAYIGRAMELFTFFTALLPTLGAAVGAIHVQGDFKTVAEQSKRTAARLAVVDKILADEPPAFARLAGSIETASDVMMADVLEWQIVFRTRPLSLPA